MNTTNQTEPQMNNTRKLGRRQQEMLNAMVRNRGVWYPGCGWVMSTVRETEKRVLRLVDIGLVRAIPATGMMDRKYVQYRVI